MLQTAKHTKRREEELAGGIIRAHPRDPREMYVFKLSFLPISSHGGLAVGAAFRRDRMRKLAA